MTRSADGAKRMLIVDDSVFVRHGYAGYEWDRTLPTYRRRIPKLPLRSHS